MAEERGWTSIPIDLGYVIFIKLSELDRISFGGVCRNWHHIAKDYNPLARIILPMLLVPVDECKTQRALYSLSTGKLYPNIRLSDIPNLRCCGSSHGWLAFVEEDLSVTLINPFKFRGDIIHLPILDTPGFAIYDESVAKLIVSPNSTPDNYTVVAIYDGMSYLAFFRSGDRDWTYTNKYIPEKTFIFDDIIFHNGLVYATGCNFSILSLDIDSSPPQIRILKERILQERTPFNLSKIWCGNYIMKSTSGDLYVIRRRCERDYITRVFKVMKLEFHQESGELISSNEVNTLGGDAFFIGESDCASVKASEYEGCKPNSIYFIHDYRFADTCRSKKNKIESSGIYNVEDKSIVRHYVRNPNHRFRPPAP